MLWLARVGRTAILGLPTCGAYSKATAADLLLPRLLSGEPASEKTVAKLGHGGILTAEPTLPLPTLRPRPRCARRLTRLVDGGPPPGAAGTCQIPLMSDRENRPDGTRSIEAIQADFRSRDYIADRSLATAVFLALAAGTAACSSKARPVSARPSSRRRSRPRSGPG